MGGLAVTSFEQYRSSRYVPALDAIRAIAVMLVITVHVHIGQWSWLAGQNGVNLFFVLSGYLITFLALREERDDGALNLKAFYIRRSFRIFPMYYLTVGLYALIILGLGVRQDKTANFLATLPYLLTYLQEIPFLFGVNGATENIPLYQSWSLGIEEKFYLVWPVLIFVVLKAAPKPARFFICAALGAICAVAPRISDYGYLLFPYFFIMSGCLVALALDEEKTYQRLCFLGGCFWPLAAALVVAHLMWPHFAIRPFGGFMDAAYTAVACLCLISLLTSGRTSAPRWLAFAGRLSYSIYLLHVLCLNVVETVLGRASLPVWVAAPLDIAGSIILSIAVAAICYLCIERPLISIGHRLSRRIKLKEKVNVSEHLTYAG